jgi:proteasome lid subunit RPN8/RPN11
VSLRLAEAARRAIAGAAEAGYPHEVCGILLGRLGAEAVAEEAAPCPNINAERSRDRYELDPLTQVKIEKGARERGLDVVGYYHSHPDHPAQASVTDSQLSWPGIYYLIQSVQAGRAGDLNAFIRTDQEKMLQPARMLLK